MRRLAWLLLGLATGLGAGESVDEVVGLADLEVRAASRPPSAADAGAGLAGALWGPGVRLAAQGSGAQRDLSIRGSTFSGAGLALGGLSLRNPQTEHFNAELPLPLEWLTEARLVTGLEQAHAATGHLVGSLAAEFAPVSPGGELALGLGEAGGRQERLAAAEVLGDSPWGAALFGWHADLPGRDYTDNRAETQAGGLHLQYRAAADQIDTVLAVQDKQFGARGFYGVSPTLPSSEATLDALLLSTWRHELALPGDVARLSLASRRFDDEYTMTTVAPRTYRNQHRTLTSTAAADGRLSSGRGRGAAWRVFVEDERIDSSGLLRGTPTDGLGEHTRRRLGLLALPFRQLGPLTLEAGGQVVCFSAEAPVPLALAGVRWAITDRQEAHLSTTETVRQPSFTELDYESPASLGNQGLENERSGAVEAGLRSRWDGGVQTRVALFRRITEHSVDWLRLAPGGRWLATDVGDVVVRGLETEATWPVGRAATVTVFGEVTRKEGAVADSASRYVFDYPAERLGAALSWRPAAWCELRTTQAAVWYADNPAREGDRTGIEADFQLILSPPVWPHARVVLACTNLFDDMLETYPGQRRARRTMSGALALAW